ncbi:SulP family inorganic anion transporter [Tepidiphilus thermophilus]|jgi:SulP family sulfate permease|uniref:High affinity sulphate transporter 1 n=1 Tax=Tepidiphilus thermophilus TaxID=876478 RepID=A0A0K6IP90_9PROT|nr:sulfate permease [Tepidiphilus thermophilus]CUB05097.1 high affinity sulphate transporter 1 [Tepidiphilus thermophilus]
MSFFRPRLIETLHGYDRGQFLADLSAGATVGVLALPLAMAFAIASGMSPSAGIWTAIVAGFLISALGGSRVQIGGPTGAFIPIVYGIVAAHGEANLLVATMLAGLLLFALGAARLGTLIRFIPLPVVIGFTNGIAVVIFLSQIKDFLGLSIDKVPAEFFGKMHALATALPTAHWPTLGFGLASLAFLLTWNRYARRQRWLARLPGPLAVLIVATAVNMLFSLPLETIGTRFGGIPQTIPTPSLPAFDITRLGQLLPPAIAIALLGAIESLLSARVADSMIDDRHDPNQELMAQGIANVVAPLFGGFAATGAIARTATNVRAGGRTPVAGIVHSLTLLAVVLVLAPLAAHVPLTSLAAIVLVTAVNMGDWHEMAPAALRRYSTKYRVILLTTFALTVLFDLTIAVEVGMVLASLAFIYQMARFTHVERLPLERRPDAHRFRREDGSLRVAAYRISGSLFFGAIHKLDELLDTEDWPDVVVLDLGKLVSIDASGLDTLRAIARELKKRGIPLVLAELNRDVFRTLRKAGFIDEIGRENLRRNLEDALAWAEGLQRKEPEISYT